MRAVVHFVRGLRGSDTYAVVLVLIALSFIWGIAGPAESWSRVVLVGLQGLALVTALWTSRTPGRYVAVAAVLAGVTVAVAAGTAGVDEELGRILVGAMSIALVAGTPVAMLRSLRELGRVTSHAIVAAVCVYLLIGMFFAAVYLILGASDDGMFAQASETSYSDYLYFSAITQTTVGYGDLTPATNAARAFASAQAMFGQIYLVTVVALIVSNLGRERAPRPGA